MPEICRFYGIVIAVFYNEHNPPHFHARYGGANVAVDICTLQVLEGGIPPRALGLVIEWASQHQDELLTDWQLARNDQRPKKIEPLR
jgi:phosphomannomutase